MTAVNIIPKFTTIATVSVAALWVQDVSACNDSNCQGIPVHILHEMQQRNIDATHATQYNRRQKQIELERIRRGDTLMAPWEWEELKRQIKNTNMKTQKAAMQDKTACNSAGITLPALIRNSTMSKPKTANHGSDASNTVSNTDTVRMEDWNWSKSTIGTLSLKEKIPIFSTKTEVLPSSTTNATIPLINSRKPTTSALQKP